MTTSPRYRILALDVDGTLLDRTGHLRPSTARAVADAAKAGIRPVLCTGRRYRRARPIAEELRLDAPIVCNSGALVKQPSDHSTLWRADLDTEVARGVFEVFRLRDEPPLSFTDRSPEHADFLIALDPTGRPLYDDYLDRNRGNAEVAPDWDLDHTHSHYHVCVIGTLDAMLETERAIHTRLPGRVCTFVQKSPRYAGTMCEVLRHDASKWSALLHLAELWGVSPAEICAVGDDMNDEQMIRGAGLGVAMGHAPEPVRAAADLVTGDHDEDGVGQLIRDYLLA